MFSRDKYRWACAALPVRISETLFTPRDNIHVDYNYLDYEIHVPTYNEEEYIEDTLKSLASQEPVLKDKVKLVVIDSRSTDNTRSIARQYADRVITVPKGKLTARNEGISFYEPDVVISADAGDIYPDGWVNEIAKPFENQDVVATFGPVFAKGRYKQRWTKLRAQMSNIISLPGNNSAIRVSAIEELGLFNEEIDQDDLLSMVLEEQVLTKARLSTVGDVRYSPFAGIYKSMRRYLMSEDRSEKYAKAQSEGERF